MNQSLTVAIDFIVMMPRVAAALSVEQKQMITKYSQRQLPSGYRAPGGRGLWVPWPSNLANLSTVYASSVDRHLQLVIPGLGLKLALPIE